ncbi:MAG: hypothetical protein JSU00_05430 [Acidobacteria bacterium]|nr:hypothetical protein [Acidobacteriota bacterium]
MNHLLVQFTYLQLLDLMTTLAFLVNGVQEANPLVRLAMQTSPNPLGGLVALKALAVTLGVFCWRMGRTKVLMRMNLLFAIVVAWNLAALIIASVRSMS